MLYVFLVESGTTLMFDMNLAMESVSSLQQAIAQACSIEVHEQVLLISGGTALKPECIVSKYSAGTDTNPIFLFARNHKDCGHGVFDEEKVNSYANLEERVRACDSMAVNNQSLLVKFQLAQSLAEISDEELKTCAQLVDTQHLQQQGWAALVANLEDHIKNLKKLFERFLIESEHYFQARPLYENLLRNFSDIIARLDQMPLLPIFYPEGADKSARHTLLTKYASGPNKVLVKLAFKYKDWIDQLSEEKLLALKHEVNKLLNSTFDTKLKEVGGIEERLFKLNELLQEARMYQMDQRKHEENLCSHHNRVSTNCDHLDLKGLDQIHQVHLQLMLENHKRLMEKSFMCKNSKAEMSSNLCTRIAWVASIQSSIYKYENLFVLYLQQLNRLNFHLHLIEQMQIAPEAYIKTVVEIRRRKTFSTNFIKWASNLSQQSSELHQKEVKTRDDFSTNNPCPLFLHDLFPGMSDRPPPFATKCPESFDVSLPNVTQDDLEYLKKVLPEFIPLLEVPPTDVMPQVSHKSAVSDSAFSSEVPSSHGMVGPSHSSTSLQSGHLFRTETLSSLGAGECANIIPEVLSPTSSPFEDPFLPPTDVESSSKLNKSGKTKKADDSGLECKKLHLTETAEREMFSPIAEEQNNVESDGDEFERVDSLPKIYGAFGTTSPSSQPDQVLESIKMSKSCVESPAGQPESLRVQVDDLQLTPSEGFRSPESNVTSHDFQTADYFFDDSMPSSITESTGISALGKSPHMVKSHHVVIAEMQGKLNEKNQALTAMKGSLRMSRSADILKMHATMSALQSIAQDLRERFSAEFNIVREVVLAQRMAIEEDSSAILEALSAIQCQAEQDKDAAVAAVEKSLTEERDKYVGLLKKAHLQIDGEAQKFADAQGEIELYQAQIDKLKVTIEEMKQEFDAELQQVKWGHKSQCDEMSWKHKAECEKLHQESAERFQKQEFQIRELYKRLTEEECRYRFIYNEKREADLEIAKEREQWAEVIRSREKISKKEVAVQNNDAPWLRENLIEEMDVQESFVTNIETNPQTVDGESDLQKCALENVELLKPLTIALYRIQETLKEELGAESSDFPKKFVERINEFVDSVVAHKLSETCSKEPHHALPSTSRDEIVDDYNIILLNLLREAQRILTSCPNLKDDDHSKEAATSFKKDDSLLREKLSKAIEICAKLDSVCRRNVKLIKTFASEREAMENEKEFLKRKIQEDHEKYQEEIEKLKSLHIAENQVSFNEAINKVTREKEEKISCLLSDKTALEKKLMVINSVIESCLEQTLIKAEQEDEKALEKLQTISNTLSEIRSKIDLPGDLVLSGNVITASYDLIRKELSALQREFQVKQKELQDTRKELQNEKEKCQKIFEKISKANHLKLSLVTCDPGDIVLFFYDEKHKNYITFHFGSTLHFLHTDSLEVLELKIPPDSPTNSWAIGVVTDKDYCLAKKKPNRYNVQHGTMFYRVRVDLWEKYKEMRCMMQLVLGTNEMPVFRQSSAEGDGAAASDSSQMSASTI